MNTSIFEQKLLPHPVTTTPNYIHANALQAQPIASREASAMETLELLSYPTSTAAVFQECKQSQGVIGKGVGMVGPWVSAITGIHTVGKAVLRELSEGRIPGKDTLIAIGTTVTKLGLGSLFVAGAPSVMTAALAAGAPEIAAAAGTAALVVTGTYIATKATDWAASKLTGTSGS